MPSLLSGLWLGWWLAGDLNPLAALADSIDGVIDVLADPGDTRVIIFALVIGALIAVLEAAVRCAIRELAGEPSLGLQRQARRMACVVHRGRDLHRVQSDPAGCRRSFASAVRPFRVSREKLAYLIDATSAPICILIPLNAWGAFNLSLLAGTGLDDPLGTFIAAIRSPSMPSSRCCCRLHHRLRLEHRPHEKGRSAHPGGSTAVARLDTAGESDLLDTVLNDAAEPRRDVGPALMLLPIAVVIGMVPVGLFVTGDGDLLAGSGSTAVLWAVLAGLATL